MSQPLLLQDQFKGFKRDMARDQIPKGYCYDMVDCVPNVLGAPVGNRAAWTTQGSLWTSINAGADKPARVAWFPQSSTQGQLLGWDQSSRAYNLTSDIDLGVTTIPIQPAFFRDLLVWGDGGSTPKKYNGSAISALGGSPPTTPRSAATWNERVIFSGRATSSAEFSSIYFSAPGNAESWDTTNATIRTNLPIFGLVPLRAGILVFHQGQTERITGDTPPSSTGIGNLSRQVLWNDIGLWGTDAFAASQDKVVWADKSGVYESDGSAITNLTKQGGIERYWQETALSSATAVKVGMWHDYAIVHTSTSLLHIATLVCDLKTRDWFRWNLHSPLTNMTVRSDSTDWFLTAPTDVKNAARLDPCFVGGGGTDGSGSAVEPSIETAYFRFGSRGRKRTKAVYATYDSRSGTAAVSYADSPEETSYTSLGVSLPATTQQERRRQPLPRNLLGASFQVQSGTASAFRLYALEIDQHSQEQSRRV